MTRRLLCLFLTCASAVWGQARLTVIHIDGNASMGPFTERLTQWYHQNQQSTSFEIGSTGSTRAIQLLIEGKVEVVQSERQLLGGEVTVLHERRGKRILQVPVAMEVAGIIVHPSNQIHELTIFDLRRILSGTVRNWKQVGGKDAPIKLYGRDANSDVRDFIEAEYMGDVSISSSVATFPKNSALYAAVAEDPNALGYATVNLGLSPRVRFIGIKASASAPAVVPTTENITSGKYPLMRELYYILAGEPSDELQRFAQWVLSPQGQLVVEATELWPLGSSDRDKGKMELASR